MVGPKCKTDVQFVLILVNVYCRLRKNCAHIARPLTQLTRKVYFVWSETTQSSFENLKRALRSAQVLRTYDISQVHLPLDITLDTSIHLTPRVHFFHFLVSVLWPAPTPRLELLPRHCILDYQTLHKQRGSIIFLSRQKGALRSKSTRHYNPARSSAQSHLALERYGDLAP
jgi:hypothetical protein